MAEQTKKQNAVVARTLSLSEQLEEIVMALRSSQAFEGAIKAVLPLFLTMGRGDSAVLWMKDGSKGTIRVLSHYNVSPETIRVLEQEPRVWQNPEGSIARAAREQRVVVQKKPQEGSPTLKEWENIASNGYPELASIISYPLVGTKGEAGGVVQLLYKTEQPLDEETQRFLKIASLALGEFIETQELYHALEEHGEGLQKEGEKFAAFQEVTRFLGNIHEEHLDYILKEIMAMVKRSLGANAVIVWRPNEKEQTRLSEFVSDGVDPIFSRKHTHLSLTKNSPTGKALLTGDSVFVEQYDTSPETVLERKEIEKSFSKTIASLASIPLTVQGEPFGVLNMYFEKGQKFSPFERYLIESFANLVSVAIGNAQYQQELQETQKAVLNILDDTEEARRRAEQERKKTESIITSFSDGLLVFNGQLQLTMINPKAEKFFGVRGIEMLGAHITELAAYSPYFQPIVEQYNKAGIEMKETEIEIGLSAVLTMMSIQLSAKQSGAGFMLVFHDVTRERQIEKLKTEFVSLAAHQLRTPLSAIKWTITLILEDEAHNLTDQQKELLSKTYRSNERMINLINDLLDVTRIEEGRYVYNPKFAHIEELVEPMVKSFQDHAKLKNLTLKLELPEEQLPRVLIDSEKIQLVVQNLLENARNYTPKGGTITVSAKNEEDQVVVAVHDTGMGIPEKEQRRVFQKFFRASNAKRVDTEGSGLGLYLIKNIIEAHEGKIWFESEEGKGTTMYFSLPAKQEMEEFLKKF